MGCCPHRLGAQALSAEPAAQLIVIMVAKNPNLLEEPPLLEETRRELVEASANGENEAEAAPAQQKPKVVEVKVCALAVLCMLTALLSFLFFPALAAVPLGIFALRRIDESDGRLNGRHLAITGLCIASTALAFWLALGVAGWIALKILQGIANFIAGLF